MIHVPDNDREVLKLANDLIEACRISQASRAAYYRLLNVITETGRYDGSKSLLNLIYRKVDTVAAHLFSPIELKFNIDFENLYPKNVYDQAAVVAKGLTRGWERNNTDLKFAQGVFESVKYGTTILKQWGQVDHREGDEDESVSLHAKLVMPWQFGVYNESETDIGTQPALCETFTITLPEVWRRIAHLPNAKKLFERIRSHSMTGTAVSDPASFFHQVLSTSQLNTGLSGATSPLPGGIVQLANDPNYAIMGPQVGAAVVTGHELWVQDDDDYTTIILIEPDIIIAPLLKKANLLVKGSRLQPYRTIQCNAVTNWFWGRSELVDLIEPQGLLSTWLDDARRLSGLQIDKILAFVGDNNIIDERYGQMREAGYINLGQGSSVTDLTPKFPPELLPMIKFLIENIHILSGFPPIMQGQGEAGVRAGSHANTLMKTASPTLRDRALIIERQCAEHADLTLSIKEAKDPQYYWTHGDTPEQAEQTKFLLSNMPEDWRVTVDSHSSSPIFADENTQMVFAAQKLGIVDGEYVIDNVNLPNKEAAKTSLREHQKQAQQKQAELLKQFPEAGEKVAVKSITGGKH
jgi:hypothetical protein